MILNSFMYFGVAVVVLTILVYALVHFNTRRNT